MLYDNHNRKINYLRLAVTDKCNLRCTYCMPENGLKWLPTKEIMTLSEMIRICMIFTEMGIEKIRITGGEPFVRNDIMDLLFELSRLRNLKELTLTTNGLLSAPLVGEFKKLGIRSVNLSLDSIDQERFHKITRRDALPRVLETLDQLLIHGIEVKINAVVMEGINTMDILPLAELTKDLPISVRFIEEMPFNGTGKSFSGIGWNYVRILNTLTNKYPEIQKQQDPAFSTSYNYKIPGYKGSVGIIASYSRTFCGTCNRLRLTPEGVLKTCLYDGGVLNIKDMVRIDFTDKDIESALLSCIGNREMNGLDAEQNRLKNNMHASMATIGG